ncbi:MAG: alanine:cation symporter family protein [Adlercreutzia equolifaciens]
MGSLLSNDLVWELADMFNQLMVIPNAIALFALSGAVLLIANAKARQARAGRGRGRLEVRARRHQCHGGRGQASSAFPAGA